MPSTSVLPDNWAQRGKIGWIWDVTSNNMTVMMPTMRMYLAMPPDAQCIFSLSDEVKEPRSFPNAILPDREAVAWTAEELQAEADLLRAKFPDEVQRLVRPTEWEHLYRYFDAHDLWFKGAWNLWNLLEHLCMENDFIVGDWAYKWCTHEEHRHRLRTWDRRVDILNLMTRADWASIGNCGGGALDVLRCELQRWHSYYFGLDPVTDQPRQCNSSAAQPSNGIFLLLAFLLSILSSLNQGR